MTITSDDVFNIIEEIAADSSKKAKISIVGKYSEHELFKRVLSYTLDPLKTFNIRPADPALTSNFTLGGSTFDDRTWQLLDDLATRVLTGNAAVEAVDAEFSRLTPNSASLLWRIVNKDFRAGFSESTVNKAIKGLIPDFPYMRCCLPKHTKISTFSWDEGVYSQEKADGMFANVDYESVNAIRLFSRSGTPFPTEPFEDLIKDIVETLESGYEHHGEFLVEKNGVVLDREIGNGILNSVQQGGSFAPDEKPVYVIWDRVPLEYVVPKGTYTKKYSERFSELKALLNKATTGSVRLIETRIVHSVAEAYQHYKEKLAEGKEGTIFKDGNAIWRDGTSTQQVKLKIEAECDLVIVGFTPGNGKNKSLFGSITCRTSDNLLEVNVSGFKDKDRQHIHSIRDTLIDTIMTVKFNDIMNPSEEGKPYSLFLPRHIEFRHDKTTADDLQRVKDQLEAAKEAHFG